MRNYSPLKRRPPELLGGLLVSENDISSHNSAEDAGGVALAQFVGRKNQGKNLEEAQLEPTIGLEPMT